MASMPVVNDVANEASRCLAVRDAARDPAPPLARAA